MAVLLKPTGYELKFTAHVNEAGMHFPYAIQGGICHSSRNLDAKLYNLLSKEENVHILRIFILKVQIYI